MKLNQALKFILPMISNVKSVGKTGSTEYDYREKFFINKYFLGCFIGDIGMSKFNYKILLAYKISLDMDFIKFERTISKNPYFLTGADYDYEEDRIVIYVFNVPKQYLADYQSVLEGRYSELSAELKLQILKFWHDDEQQSLLHSILFKGDKIKDFWKQRSLNPLFYCADGEYWFLPKLETEMFNIEKYRKE